MLKLFQHEDRWADYLPLELYFSNNKSRQTKQTNRQKKKQKKKTNTKDKKQKTNRSIFFSLNVSSILTLN